MLKEINNKANKGFNNKRDISRSDLAHMVTNLRKELKDQIEENKKLEKKVDGLITVVDLVREHIKENTRWFDSEYAKVYGELCTCEGANSNRLEVLTNPSKLLEILERVNEE